MSNNFAKAIDLLSNKWYNYNVNKRATKKQIKKPKEKEKMKIKITYTENNELWAIERLAKENGYTNKPEWLTPEMINSYEARMKSNA